jgi:hypothetical protein
MNDDPYPAPSDYDQLELARRIVDAVTDVVEQFGPEHPLLDELIAQRLEELLANGATRRGSVFAGANPRQHDL